MLKLAITGKGGVGKTTFAALLARVFVERGQQVLAIDADPATGLAAACGVPPGGKGDHPCRGDGRPDLRAHGCT